MIKGMTGFGSAEIVTDGIRGTAEIKSVNHRYLDIVYYLPPGFAYVENKIQQIISQFVERGRVTVSLKINSKPGPTVSFNKGIARQYLKHSQSLKKEFGLKGELSLSDLVQFPGVFESKDTIIDPETLWPSIEKAIGMAAKSLSKMREREGRSLAKDVSNQIRRIFLQINKIHSRVKALLRERKRHLTDEEFLGFQKDNDINEELARLAHHIDEIRLLLRSEVPIGKKLDFIAQEMQREINTVGSKVQDKIVSNAVIAIKTKIEKIREQSQNLE